MAELELSGPYLLTVDSIKEHLSDVISPGVVVFGSFDREGRWQVQKTDRSDAHIRARLWANASQYAYFSFRLCASAEEAYRSHCELFHRFRLPHDHHPCPPEGRSLECTICSRRLDCEHREAMGGPLG